MMDIDWDNAPEWATHYTPMTRQFLYINEAGEWYEDREECLPTGPAHPSEPSKLIPRPTKPAAPEWGGEGLPPVGVECEFRSKGGSLNNGDQIEWIECKVIAITKRYAILCHIRHGYAVDHECSHSLGQIEFRPIRTKEQRERDELVKKACEVITSGYSFYIGAEELANKLYDAGLLQNQECD